MVSSRIYVHKTSAAEEGEWQQFAVWTDRDVANMRIVVHKIELYNPAFRYPRLPTGVVRAKDELDVYRFVESLNS